MKTALLSSLLLVAFAAPAFAETGRLVEVKVEARDGADYREYRHRGQSHIAGDPGEAYQISLRNMSNERVMVVLSVDGVNAVSGQTAGYQQSGYVLNPRQTTVVTGWRKSLDQVAQFYFTSLGDSYASRTGRPNDVGVIGAAVFREQRPQVHLRRDRSRPQAEAAPPMAAGPQMGTGHGAIEDSSVNRTNFERESSNPNEVLAIRYDSRRNLVAAGVIPDRRRYNDRDDPNPFPRDQGFVADPPRYRN